MKRFHIHLDLTAIIVLIAVGVLLPVMLATAAGIVALVIADDAGGIVTGVLVISFAVTAGGSALITVVLTGRKARLARRQADFVANVSHELRTPLSAIRLYTQTLQSERVAGNPDEAAHCLATILRETEWLEVMIDQVLTWRASSRGMPALNMQAKPVNNAVNQAVARFRSMSIPDELTLETAVNSRLSVPHNERALNAVVLNLLTNASKYTGPDKQIKVRVYDARDVVVTEVEDNGTGLTATEARHVFKPFYRAPRPDGSDAGGVGLGLAIAQHLVQAHNGTLTVSSEKGKGSIFAVRLPVAEGDLAS